MKNEYRGMNPNPDDIDAVCKSMRGTVEFVGSNLDPDEDWMPVLVCFGDQPTIIGIPMLGQPELKDMMAQTVIPDTIKQAKPDFVALVTMGWMVQYNTNTLEGTAAMMRDEAKYAPGNIADRPHKEEVVTVYVVSKNGEERQDMAYVHRHPTLHPTLQWRDDISQQSKAEGRFPDGLRAGMEQAWKGGGK
jgi:hypothetical protein